MRAAMKRAERAAIDAYAGPVQRIPRGESAFGYHWCEEKQALVSKRKLVFNGWDRRRTGSSANANRRAARLRCIEMACDLRDKGHSVAEIAETMKKSQYTIREYFRDGVSS